MPGLATIQLTSPIGSLPGVGAKRATAFRRLGLISVAHLIHSVPARYEHESAEATISELVAGQNISARGEITATRLAGRGGKQRFEAVMMDHTGRLDLVWFNGGYLRHKIQPGVRLRVQGRSRRLGSNLQLANPAWELIVEGRGEPEARDERLRPVYHASEDLPSRAIEKAVSDALPAALPLIQDHLPEKFRRDRALVGLSEAYRMMHAPQSLEEVAAARRRLAYDELLLLQLGVQMKRAAVRKTMKAPALRWTDQIDAHIRARFAYALTPGQNDVIKQIVGELTKQTPANRLIQGDVGSGKTVIALYAMLMAVASKHQAAMMAPTELLAEQHYLTITQMLDGSRLRIALLTGGMAPAERAATLAGIASGEVHIVVGTHALLTESVRFDSLAVVVIDEQHRFGVHQRARLRTKGVEVAPLPALPAPSDNLGMTPHTLVMTATPIPRTLALTVFGDLDVSTIRGMPPGRRPVRTRLVGVDKTDDVYAYVRTRLDKGEQAYVVLPTIEGAGGETGIMRDVRSTLKRLESGELAGKRVAALHGRLKRATRGQIMERFRAGLIDALVTTTVIEVGVDVANASIMVVEHAERFGLAQLHQLRGRVGRGSKAAVCVLIGEPTTPDAEQRLRAISETSDGFALAEKDLEIRGPGELLGARQSGLAPFRIADLPRDMDLLMMARRDAAAWIERSPALTAPDEAVLRSRLLKTHGEALGLADVA